VVFWGSDVPRAEVVRRIRFLPLAYPACTMFDYQNLAFVAAGEVVATVTGTPWDDFVERRIFRPLGMTRSTTRVSDLGKFQNVATSHAPRNGKVAPIPFLNLDNAAPAGSIVSSVNDMARYARMLVRGGELEGVRLFKKETVELMTSVQSPPTIAAKRGLGWDIDSPFAGQRGEVFPIGGYGHTGWTGGSIWIDPGSEAFVIFLSNRNHPTEKGDVRALRKTLGTLAAEAVQK